MVKKIKVEGEEFHEKKIKPSNANITVEDIKAIMQETSDVKERILEAVSNKLFDKNLLNMISRLDNNMAFYVIKHLIINGFYYRYYSSLTYKITFEPVYNNKKECVYPFYKSNVKYNDENAIKISSSAYQTFLDDLREITISFKGQGRAELISLFDSLNERIRREEANQGLLHNLGLGGK